MDGRTQTRLEETFLFLLLHSGPHPSTLPRASGTAVVGAWPRLI